MEIILIIIAVIIVFGIIGSTTGTNAPGQDSNNNSDNSVAHVFKTSQQDTKDKFERFTLRKNKWLTAVVDRDLEIELEDYVYRGNHNDLREQVLKAYAEMPWKEGITFICYTPEEAAACYGKSTFTKKERENIAKNNRLEALRILLAQKGKLRSIDAEYGIANNGFGAPTTKMMHEWNTDSANFALWIDDQLRMHGICERLYIETSLQVAFHLTQENKFRNGSYKWEPAIYPSTKIQG